MNVQYIFLSILLPFAMMATSRNETSDDGGLEKTQTTNNSKKSKKSSNKSQEDSKTDSNENSESDTKNNRGGSRNKRSSAKSASDLLNSVCLLLKLISHGLLN